MAHLDLRSTLGSAYLAVRRSTFVSVLKILRFASAEMRAYESDNVRLARKVLDLESRLAKVHSMEVRSPGFLNGLGGRTAVGTYRNENLASFMEHMNRIGDLSLSLGQNQADFLLQTVVKADLECLFAAPYVTAEEGRRRALCEHMVTDPAQRTRLTGTEEYHERSRRAFVSDVLSSGIDTSVQELVRRSGEMPRGATPRPDDD